MPQDAVRRAVVTDEAQYRGICTASTVVHEGVKCQRRQQHALEQLRGIGKVRSRGAQQLGLTQRQVCHLGPEENTTLSQRWPGRCAVQPAAFDATAHHSTACS